MYLMYDNRFIGAREAMEWGFVSDVFPADRLEEATMAYADRASRQDPFRLRMMKHSIHQMRESQGFTPHILSSYSDRMVRPANDTPLTEQPEDAGWRRYLSVERAREHRAAEGGTPQASSRAALTPAAIAGP